MGDAQAKARADIPILKKSGISATSETKSLDNPNARCYNIILRLKMESVLNIFQNKISSWSSSGALSDSIQAGLTGGASLPQQLIDAIEAWGSDKLEGLPDIQIVDTQALSGNLGAFAASNNTIYLNSILVESPLTTEIVLAHELGHFLVDKFLEPHSEKHINHFVGSLIPTAYVVFDALKEAASTGATTVNLPNGESLNAEFFLTELHNALDANLLGMLSDASKRAVALGQNNCDDPIPTNQFGLQYRSAAHFDNNDITGSLKVIRSWYEDGLAHFNDTNIPESKWTKTKLGFVNFEDPNWQSGKINPAFTGDDAGLQLLLYRFGQINHAFQDFYTHSNWTSLIGAEGSRKPFAQNTLLDARYDLPEVKAQGQLITGNLPIIKGAKEEKFQQVMIVGKDVDFSKTLKVEATIPTLTFNSKSLKDTLKSLNKFKNEISTNSLSWQKYLFGIKDQNFYWRVNSDLTSLTDAQTLKDPTLKATTLSGKDIFGLATGATWNLPYRDPDYSVPLIDTSKLGMTIARAVFKGLDHGGFAGTQNMLIPDPYNPTNTKKKYNTNLGPLARDSENTPGHSEAMALARLQTIHEWDRLGNLIYSTYGVDGLTRFANFALNEEDRENYISTYSTPNGKWTQWPAYNIDKNTTYFSADYTTGIAVPEVELRLITEVYADPISGEITARPQLQFSPVDEISGNWIDSANTDAFFTAERHDGLSDEILKKIIVPKSVSHTEQVSRAFWTEDNYDEGADALGTIYYIESRNNSIPIDIYNFSLGIDKIVLVDNNGSPLSEIGHHWGIQDYKLGRQEAKDKYNIHINTTPTSRRNDSAWVINKDQIAKANGNTNGVSLSGEDLFYDYDLTTSSDQALNFINFSGNVPFVKLVDGKLVVTSDVSKYANQEFTANISVADGAGGVHADLMRIVVDPSLTTNGSDVILSGQLFDISFSKQDSEIYSIYAAIDINNGQNDIEEFSIVASVSGQVNGNPNGYNPLNQRLKLGHAQDSGTVKFYLQTTHAEAPTELRLERDESGSYSLFNGIDAVAKLSPISETSLPKSIAYEINRFNLTNGSGTVAGFMLSDPIENGFILDYSTFSSAAYSSKVGFYLTDIRYGKIVDPLTGHMVSADSSQLAATIDQYSIFESDIVKNNSNHQAAFKLNQSIDLHNIVFTPYIKTNTGQATYLYGCDAALNPDGFDHIAKMGQGIFGVEDMFGGGDKDFNDILYRFNSIQAL